jgi:quercetin dioxygenase-like cupin family protein
MERKQFIGSIAGLYGALAITRIQDQQLASDTVKGIKIDAGTGRLHGHMKLKGVNSNIIDLKVSGKDTNGGLAIFEQTSISQGRGTPLHIHRHQDEIFYVIDGRYYFMVGPDKHYLGAGDSIFLPRNVAHAWTQVSEKGKMTITFQPAGKMEEFFVRMSTLDHEPSHEEMAKIFAENDMSIVGPPLKIE